MLNGTEKIETICVKSEQIQRIFAKFIFINEYCSILYIGSRTTLVNTSKISYRSDMYNLKYKLVGTVFM